MTGINCELNIAEDANYDIIIKKDRTLNQLFDAYFTSGSTDYPFDFTVYSGATLEVRKTFNSEYVVLTFSTTDGSIVLGADGQFSLVKSAALLDVIRAGDYQYDMYLSSASKPKRAFLYGDFKIRDRITE